MGTFSTAYREQNKGGAFMPFPKTSNNKMQIFRFILKTNTLLVLNFALYRIRADLKCTKPRLSEK